MRPLWCWPEHRFGRSVQLGRLRDAGYITIAKAFVGNTPRMTASMTPAGHVAFGEYRSYLEGLLDATS